MKLLTRKAAVFVAAAATAFGSIAVAQAVPTEGEPGAIVNDDVSAQIVGGKITKERWPFMVSLGGCGGSLVAPEWVVTAAHCVSRNSGTVRIDSNDKRAGGEVIRFVESIRHPQYGGREEGYDIALLRLERPAKAQPIEIAGEVGPVNTQTKILGWGATHPRRRGGSRYLKELDTKVNDPSVCRTIAGGINPSLEICTDNPGGNQGACFGDSGGPQIKMENGRWVLVGATSRGDNVCAQRSSIYTSVPDHIDWIRKASNNEIPAPGGVRPTPTVTPTVTPTGTPTTGPTSTPTVAPTETPTVAPTTNPDARTITVNLSRAGEYTDEMREAMKIWNSHVPEINLVTSNSRYADVTVGTGPGWPYAQPRSLGRGHVHMGSRAMNQGHHALRVATHELGHIFGMPDRRTGKCEDLMSGSSAGTSCKNPHPSKAEINEVRGYFQRGWFTAEQTRRLSEPHVCDDSHDHGSTQSPAAEHPSGAL